MASVPMIAIVDDDKRARLSLDCLVRSLGFATCAFASAEDCLTADLDAFECVISDVQMPGVNGVQLVHALRSRPRCPPIILITAFPRSDLRKQAVDAGAAFFAEKPISPDTLLDMLSALSIKKES